MKAITLNKPRNLQRIEIDPPQSPRGNEVLLKVRKVGICGTDLHAYQGEQPFFTYPRILGHEIAAEVMAIGDQVTHLKVGDLCAVVPYRNIQIDQAVRNGKPNCGSSLSVFGVHEDGAMTEHFLFDANYVFQANGLSLDQIAIMEPLAIGSHAVERADIKTSDRVLILGAGPIGIAALAMGLLKTSYIAVADVNQNRLDFVSRKFKVNTINSEGDVNGDLTRIFQGDRPTVVIDATGDKGSMMKCLEYAAHGGTIVYVGIFIGEIVLYDPDFHRKEITLKASRNALAEDFIRIIGLLKTGTLDMNGYITHRIPFDRLPESFDRLYLPEEGVIKAIVDF